MWNFDGKIALVTGASRGIGRAIAAQLMQQGATVVGTATTEVGVQKINELLTDNKSFGVVLDVTRPESIEHCLAVVADRVGDPSILVNNAGVTADNLFLRMQEAEWFKTLDANLTGVFRLTKSCLKPMLKARWGRIINISSVVALTGNPGQANYAAAKAGVIGFSKSIAREIASRNITVNVVAPGFIETDMTSKLSKEQQEALLQQIPIGRMGSAEDIAAAVTFLASNGAAYITGEVMQVNGGMLMD